MSIKIEESLPLMNVKRMTKEEVLNHEKKEYNPETWEKVVNRYDKFQDVVFLERTESPNAYPELFAIYTIPEGIRLIGEVSYSGSIVAGGFCRVILDEYHIYTEKPFPQRDGFVANNPQGREWMAKMSTEFRWIFSNKLPLSKTIEREIEVA